MTMEGMTDKQLLSHTKLELVSYIRELEQAKEQAEEQNDSDTVHTDTTVQPMTEATNNIKVSYDIFNSNTKGMHRF